MKLQLAPVLIFAISLLATSYVNAQVGINTTTPRTTLEVGGDAVVSGNITIGNYTSLTSSEQSTFLIQDGDNNVKALDVSNPTGAALAYIQEYQIVNPDEDWVREFDTGIPASEFTLITISANYDVELNTSDSNGASDNSSLPYTATFVKAGTWHIIADYPMAANLDPSEIGTWTIKTLIFSNDLSKQFGSIEVPMSNTTTGSATSPIIE